MHGESACSRAPMPENRPCAWTKRKILPSQSTAGRVSPSDASVANRSREFARRTSPLIIQPCNDTDDASEAGPPGQLERSWSRGSSSNVRRLLRFRTCCCGRGFLFVQRFWISQYENLRFVWVSSLQHGLKVLNLFSPLFFSVVARRSISRASDSQINAAESSGF